MDVYLEGIVNLLCFELNLVKVEDYKLILLQAVFLYIRLKIDFNVLLVFSRKNMQNSRKYENH